MAEARTTCAAAQGFMHFTRPLTEWQEIVRQHRLATGLLRHEVARRNMLQFPLFDLRAAQVGDDALSSFLVATFREYWAKAERAGVSGSFYAWVDEQADQLRCSFVQGVELPFDCRVEVVVDPGAIVNQALRVPAARGIPLAELDSVEWTDLDSVEWTDPEQVDDAFVLTVYARVVNVIP